MRRTSVKQDDRQSLPPRGSIIGGTQHGSMGLINPSLVGTMISMQSEAIFRNKARYDYELDQRLVVGNGISTLPPFKSTVAITTTSSNSFMHDNDEERYLVYASGELMDTLSAQKIDIHDDDDDNDDTTIRSHNVNQQDCSSSLCTLSEGDPILTVNSLSHDTCEGGHLLAQTRQELFHAHLTSSYNTTSLKDTLSLDTVEKWRLPEEISSVSACRNNQCQAAAVRTDTCLLYNWNPIDGPISFRWNQGSVSQDENQLNSRSRTVEMSLHSQVCYTATQRDRVKVVDFRTAGQLNTLVPAELFSSGNASTAVYSNFNITSLCQHATESHYLYVCAEAASQRTQVRRVFQSDESAVTFLIDTRYPKSSVSRRFIPEAHSNMNPCMKSSYSRKVCASRDADMVVGYSSWGPQVMIHTQQQHSSHKGSNISVHDEYTSTNVEMFSATKPFGAASDSIRWSVTGFPVVDVASTRIMTTGAAVLTQYQCASNEKGVNDVNSNENSTKRRKLEVSSNDNKEVLLLYHQNSVGDVYSQTILAKNEIQNEPCQRYYRHKYTNVFAEDWKHCNQYALPSSTFLLPSDTTAAGSSSAAAHPVASQRSPQQQLCATQEKTDDNMSLESLLKNTKLPLFQRLQKQSLSLWDICTEITAMVTTTLDVNRVRAHLKTSVKGGGLGLVELDVGILTKDSWKTLCDGYFVNRGASSDATRHEVCTCDEKSMTKLCGRSSCIRIHQLVYMSEITMKGYIATESMHKEPATLSSSATVNPTMMAQLDSAW